MRTPGALVTGNGYKTIDALEGTIEPTFHIVPDLDEFLAELGPSPGAASEHAEPTYDLASRPAKARRYDPWRERAAPRRTTRA